MTHRRAYRAFALVLALASVACTSIGRGDPEPIPADARIAAVAEFHGAAIGTDALRGELQAD